MVREKEPRGVARFEQSFVAQGYVVFAIAVQVGIGAHPMLVRVEECGWRRLAALLLRYLFTPQFLGSSMMRWLLLPQNLSVGSRWESMNGPSTSTSM